MADEWIVWRIVTSEYTRGQSYHEICEHWTLDDCDDANCVIDAYELAHARAVKAAEDAAKRNR